jgi:hypothetical protein
MNESKPTIDLYYVRIPNGQEFGPADRATILEWEAQGRVNDTCQIRSQAGMEIIEFSSWKQNQHESSTPSNAPVNSSVNSSNNSSKYSNVNVYGDQIGRVDVPANQSIVVGRSRATAVLIFSICSWLLCVTILFAPVCAMLAIGLGVSELGRIKRGEVSEEQRHIVWIGIGLGVANLIFTAIFALYGLIAAIVA